MKINRGFTLLELLVALAVFAILATITSTAMYQAFSTRARVTLQADRLSEVQLAMAIIRRDTQQMVMRSVLGNDVHLFPPFIGRANYIEFTRGGNNSSIEDEVYSRLIRVAYLCKADRLIRRSWSVLDGPNRAQRQDNVLLAGIDKCKFAFLTHTQQVLTEWQQYALQSDQRQETLPPALQFNLQLNDWGTMSLLFIVPGALYAE